MTLPAAVIHARLDADPSDSAARLLPAEHCDEHGDAEQARGLRWLAERHKWPYRINYARNGSPWHDWRNARGAEWKDVALLPADIFIRIEGHNEGEERRKCFPTRRSAESAFCAALAATGEGE